MPDSPEYTRTTRILQSSPSHSMSLGKAHGSQKHISSICPRKNSHKQMPTNKAPQRKKTRTIPPTHLPQPRGWHPKYTTFTAIPINSDLDAAPTGHYAITHHPISRAKALIHAPDSRLITAITKAKLHKLQNLYQPPPDNTPFPRAIAQLILRYKL